MLVEQKRNIGNNQIITCGSEKKVIGIKKTRQLVFLLLFGLKVLMISSSLIDKDALSSVTMEKVYVPVFGISIYPENITENKS